MQRELTVMNHAECKMAQCQTVAHLRRRQWRKRLSACQNRHVFRSIGKPVARQRRRPPAAAAWQNIAFSIRAQAYYIRIYISLERLEKFHAHIHTCAHTYSIKHTLNSQAQTYVNTRMHTHTQIRTCADTHMHAYAKTHMHAHMQTRIRARICHAHENTYADTQVHTQTKHLLLRSGATH